MKRVMVRYKLKSDRVAEHEALLQQVFTQLAETDPAGFRYEVWKLADGVSYAHLAVIEAAENPLLSLAAFKAFSADIKDRCAELPISSEATQTAAFLPSAAR